MQDARNFELNNLKEFGDTFKLATERPKDLDFLNKPDGTKLSSCTGLEQRTVTFADDCQVATRNCNRVGHDLKEFGAWELSIPPPYDMVDILNHPVLDENTKLEYQFIYNVNGGRARGRPRLVKGHSCYDVNPAEANQVSKL